jgi:hypothetical protein
MNDTKEPKGSLAILIALYELYKSHLDDNEVLDHIITTAWELCFTIHIDYDGAFHSLAELAQATQTRGIQPHPDDHYVQDIEQTIELMQADAQNYYTA